MAPPHTSKKSTTMKQTVSHKGHQEPHKHMNEQAEEEYDEISEELDVDSDEEAKLVRSQSQSQDNSDGKLEQLMVDMVDAQRKRHRVRKARVYKAYAKSHTETKKAITDIFDEHEANAAKAYDAQLKRLQYLIAKKEKIEKTMTEKLAIVRSRYNSHSKDFQRVLEHRSKELR